MRKIYMVLAVLLAAVTAHAQDVIVKTDKTEIKIKVLEIDENSVKYKRFDFLDGPVYSMKKSEIFVIVYQNGKTETFAAEEAKPALADNPAPPAVSEQPAPQSQAAATVAPLATAAPPATLAPPAQPVAEQKSGEKSPVRPADGIQPKQLKRMVLGGGLHNGYPEGFGLKGAATLGFENIHADPARCFLSFLNHTGEGWSLNYMPGKLVERDDHFLTFSKWYGSVYLFKEWGTKRSSIGVISGLAVNHTRGQIQTGNYYKGKPGLPVQYYTAGMRGGTYVQTYLTSNKKGERSLFVRLGFDKFFMLKGTHSGMTYFSIGL